MNVEQAREFLKVIQQTPYDVFYATIMLHERLDAKPEQINKNILDKVWKIIEDYENIYNEDLRIDIDGLKKYLTKNKDIERG